jgi:tetratricopeptide (TPR) repeat protein
MNHVSTESDLVERLPRTTEPSRQAGVILDDAAKRTLRAAATVGSSFDAGIVARLLDVPRSEVLDSLQRSRDAGLAIVDRGSAQFRMPSAMQRWLIASTLPSLREQWLDRLAGLRGPSSLPQVATVDPVDNTDVEQRLDAASQLVRMGETRRAGPLLRAVATEIGQMDPIEGALLRARLALERARIRWLGVGLDSSLTLDGAFSGALHAHRAFGSLAPPALRADAASVVAGIAYDLGDGASLETAMTIVREVRAALVDEGAINEAATLLNDEASLELRMGRCTKVRELLAHSRATVATRLSEAPADLLLRRDLAETHHMLAKLALHTPPAAPAPAPASELEESLHWAHLAEETFVELGADRDVARVRETRARLLMKQRRFGDAEAAFRASLRSVDEAADLTGLARVTAGLAEVLIEQGKAHEALALLTSSIELNRAKGSPVGLSFDERGLAALESAITADADGGPELASELAHAKGKLTDALEAIAK